MLTDALLVASTDNVLEVNEETKYIFMYRQQGQ
jgi:hypothetical protein